MTTKHLCSQQYGRLESKVKFQLIKEKKQCGLSYIQCSESKFQIL